MPFEGAACLMQSSAGGYDNMSSTAVVVVLHVLFVDGHGIPELTRAKH